MHYAVPHAICGILAKQMSGKDIKIMTTLHGTDITVLGYDHSLKGAIKFGIEESDIVTSVSHSLAEQTKEIIHTEKKLYLYITSSEKMSFQLVMMKASNLITVLNHMKRY